MADHHLCVAIYANHDQADEAFSRLRADGSDMSLFSCVGRDYWKGMVGSRNAGERFHHNGDRGAFWERLWLGLRGWGVFWFFEDGPMLVAGPLVRAMVANQEAGDDNGSKTGIARALSGIGIPQESLVQYENALARDRVLVFMQGALAEIEIAQRILNDTRAINHTIHHDAPD